ncbi:hypothetical protein FNV43_RR06289 [Rhamnella rubrinervis]|uniref:BHLH domain-containing protein n=1 Tax=Rhamnella rubrinervis TaxID=2594499 RepID=A0A8K0HE90_9ROSA|nr:hypothetical protein FNV43_RR06289 [Rhamnella rubrinervis]
MALSFCSSWGSSGGGGGATTASTIHQHLHHQDSTRLSFSQTQPDQLASHFFGLDYNLSLPDTCIDSLFDTNTNNNYYSENYYMTTDYCLPNFHTPPPENINFLPNQTQISPQLDHHYHEFEPLSFPKRLKSYENHYDQMDTISPLFFNGYVPLPEVLPTTQVFPPVLQEASVSVPSHGYVGGNSTSPKKTTSGVLSAQSIAARERRRKITEKTQELGKLIPGGNKMNTAEMFHAASNYVKFLQAQVSLLQFMGFIQETKEEVELQTEGLEVLASQTIQEKLYTEEKCLVPIEFVQVLANDPEIHSRPFFKEINQLMMQSQGPIQE